MTYKVSKHFGNNGPTMYSSTINEEFLLFLKDLAEQTRAHNENVGKHLWSDNSSALEKHLKVPFYEQQVGTFANYVGSHVLNYINTAEQSTYTGVNFYLPVAWINFQKENEYIDFHTHGGDMSAVIYIDVPENIFEDNKLNGYIEFAHGDQKHAIRPATGDILLFPSDLNHTVHPYRTSVERISMSFNLGDFNLE
jgi:uncharacterized protein (TIGR02466 family)